MSDRYQDELLQKQMANDNPFDTYVTKPETGKGLFEGPPQRCDCGNFFQLIDYDPLDPNIKAKFGGGFG